MGQQASPPLPDPARFARVVAGALEGAGDPRALARDVARMSALFTVERSARPSGYMNDPGLVRAYRGFFAPLNAGKVAAAIARYRDEGLVALPAAPRVLDLGAGPLSATVGTALVAGGLGAAVGVDRSRGALEHGARWLSSSGFDAPVRLVVDDLRRARLDTLGPPFDVVVIANALNEVGDARRDAEVRAQIVEDALAVTAEDGFVLVVEPATRVHARALMRVRDLVAARPGAHVVAPCPRGVSSCPLLASAGDWCFADLPWAPPPALRALERAAGLRNDVLQGALLVVARRAPPARAGARVVGGVMRSERAVRRYLCTVDGRRTLEGDARGLPPAAAAALRGEWLASTDGARVVVEPHRAERSPRGRPAPRRRR